MKRVQLLIAVTLLTTTIASAREHNTESRNLRDKNYEVMLITESDSDSPTIYEYESPEAIRLHLNERKEAREIGKEIISEQVSTVVPTGFNAAQAPSFIFTHKENKFAFAIGGFISLRTSYDFNGTVNDIDFVTADIPIPNNYASHQQLIMDASTSRLYLAGVVNSRALGSIEIFVDMDFRGNTGYDEIEGITNHYSPRIRSAYASFLGLTIGRDVTTFCDLDSAPQTIDFQGPNAYSFNFATLIRYSRTLCNDHLTMAIALEQSNLSASYDSTFEPIPQRMPDVPIFLQYQFGKERQSHLRASAVFRNMYAYNATTEENTSLFGWGVQASGRLNPVKWMGICFNGTYGEGITNYIQDLNGLGLDFTPDPTNSATIQTMPMFGWQAAANFNLTNRLTMTGGYSMVQVQKSHGYYAADQYRRGQYVFGNIFYNITPRLQVAAEYLYGTRRNMDCSNSSANRASLMAQMSF